MDTTRTRNWERYAPLSGVIFFALLLASFLSGGETPDATDDAATVVKWFTDHSGAQTASAILGALAVIFFLWFAGVLRARLAAFEGGTGRLASTAFGGMILFAVSGALFASFTFALVDVADNSTVSPAAVQAINVLNNDTFLTLVPAVIVAALASGICVLRSGALPRWLGWTAIVIGIAGFLGPIGFFAFLAFCIWVLIASIVIFRAGPPPATPVAAPPAAPPSAT